MPGSTTGKKMGKLEGEQILEAKIMLGLLLDQVHFSGGM